MKIIIVGCGKVGASLADQLNQEGHEIVVIDNKPSAVNRITDDLDVMGIVGNGASHIVLEEAGISEANLLITVTNSDEFNLLCCLIAKKTSDCHTIARVRNPEYNEEITFIREEMGLSLTINPELETANEISRLIRIPSAIKIDTFAKGKVELLKFEIPQGSLLDNMPIMHMNSKLKTKILVCSVERENEVFIPSGNFVLKSKDKISFVASPRNTTALFHKLDLSSDYIKNVMLIGGGTIAVYLASILSKMNVKVKIIEQDRARCEELSEALPSALIINANASDHNVLIEESLEDMDAFASLTNLDEENIILSLYAHNKSKAKVFTKITRLNYDDIIKEMPLGIIINPQSITANQIIQHVRAMENPKGSNVETLYKIVGNKVEALEFRVKKNSSMIGIPLEKLETKENLLVACINRKGKIIIPSGQDSIQLGDTVIIVTTHTGLNDLNDILA